MNLHVKIIPLQAFFAIFLQIASINSYKSQRCHKWLLYLLFVLRGYIHWLQCSLRIVPDGKLAKITLKIHSDLSLQNYQVSCLEVFGPSWAGGLPFLGAQTQTDQLKVVEMVYQANKFTS